MLCPVLHWPQGVRTLRAAVTNQSRRVDSNLETGNHGRARLTPKRCRKK